MPRIDRRAFLASTAAITILPFAARADAHSAFVFETAMGDLTVHPISHASLVLETGDGIIYVDPVGEPSAYDGLPAPDLILITHEHGDHYNADTLAAIDTPDTRFVTNPAVFDMLTDAQRDRATALANGEGTGLGDLGIDAIAAYNMTEGRLQFHPEGRDNGYVLSFRDFRVYISGDTEDIPEMRALENIDLAFVCMNLPFTMDAEAAADAVAEFAPGVVFPYHYRGRDGGSQDPEAFAAMLPDGIEARMAAWYG